MFIKQPVCKYLEYLFPQLIQTKKNSPVNWCIDKLYPGIIACEAHKVLTAKGIKSQSRKPQQVVYYDPLVWHSGKGKIAKMKNIKGGFSRKCLENVFSSQFLQILNQRATHKIGGFTSTQTYTTNVLKNLKMIVLV